MSKDLAALATRALIYTFPVYEMARVRHRVLFAGENRRRVQPNSFAHGRALLDPRNKTVTLPNVDTLYSTAWLDLSAGPIRLEVPATAGRYYSLAFMDFFTNVYDIVGRRTVGTNGATCLIVGPDWQGTAPKGMRLVRSPTRWNWLLSRIVVDGPEDLAAVHALQDGLRLTPEGTATATNADRLAVPLEPPDEMTYFAVVNAALAENGPPAADAAELAALAPLGVGPGLAFASDRLPQAERDAVRLGLAEGRRRLKSGGITAEAPGWGWSSMELGRYGTNYAFRAAVALSGLAALPPEEAMYMTCGSDAAGAPLVGSRRYRLRFAAGGEPTVNAFWSLTMYEVEPDGRAYLVPNPIGRYAIGDRTAGLERGPDGALDILLQHERPAGSAANWLPAPAGPFRVCLRVYEAREPILAGRYVIPPVERLA